MSKFLSGFPKVNHDFEAYTHTHIHPQSTQKRKGKVSRQVPFLPPYHNPDHHWEPTPLLKRVLHRDHTLTYGCQGGHMRNVTSNVVLMYQQASLMSSFLHDLGLAYLKDCLLVSLCATVVIKSLLLAIPQLRMAHLASTRGWDFSIMDPMTQATEEGRQGPCLKILRISIC